MVAVPDRVVRYVAGDDAHSLGFLYKGLRELRLQPFASSLNLQEFVDLAVLQQAHKDFVFRVQFVEVATKTSMNLLPETLSVGGSSNDEFPGKDGVLRYMRSVLNPRLQARHNSAFDREVWGLFDDFRSKYFSSQRVARGRLLAEIPRVKEFEVHRGSLDYRLRQVGDDAYESLFSSLVAAPVLYLLPGESRQDLIEKSVEEYQGLPKIASTAHAPRLRVALDRFRSYRDRPDETLSFFEGVSRDDWKSEDCFIREQYASEVSELLGGYALEKKVIDSSHWTDDL